MSERKYRCVACNNQTTSVTSAVPKFKNDQHKEKWFELLNLAEDKVTKNSKICRSHFLDSDFMLKKLNEGALPSQNLPVRLIIINFVHLLALGVPTSSGFT